MECRIEVYDDYGNLVGWKVYTVDGGWSYQSITDRKKIRDKLRSEPVY